MSEESVVRDLFDRWDRDGSWSGVPLIGKHTEAAPNSSTGSGRCLSSATTALTLFPLFRGEAETLRPRNLVAQVGVAAGRLNRHRASRGGALPAMRQRAAGAWRVVAAIGTVPFCWRAAEGFDSRIDRRHVVIAETLAPVANPTCRPATALRAESRIGVGFFVVGHSPASAKSRIPSKIVDRSHDRRVNSTRRGIGAP
jgi:hypothetical protein